MSAAAVVDVDDVSRCPLGVRCESCGVEDPTEEDQPGLAVHTAHTQLGVMCLTMCARCAASDCAPPVSLRTAVNLVGQHAAHLGIDVDEMAAAMEAEPTGRRSWSASGP